MSKKNPLATPWWNDMLDRREANQRIAAAALLAAGGAAAGCNSGASSDGGSASADEPRDALAVQRQEGWSVGAEGTGVRVDNASATDSLGTEGWVAYRDPTRLIAATTPSEEAWRSHASPALIQALGQSSLATQLTPTSSPALDEAYGRAYALGELIFASEDAHQTLVILDLPGASSVAAAAGMAGDVEPVFWFDNWPHPRGVVPSHQTLAGLLTYAAELDAARGERASAGQARPHAIVLDSNRLAAYTDDPDTFDNRYMADLPTPEQLEALGVTRVMYVRPQSEDQELDDVNEPLVALAEGGIDVQKIGLGAFLRSEESAGKPGAKPEGEDPRASRHGRYYYGGSEETHGYYYRHYPLFIPLIIPGRTTWSRTPRAPSAARAAAPSWRPSPRQTMFSSRTTGGTGGVGRTRPTGFGRVSQRAAQAPGKPSSGRTTPARRSTGRSGSTGRYSGRSGTAG